MEDGRRRMALDTIIYLPAKVAEGLISMFTLNFVTGFLGKEVYGRFGTLSTTVNFAYILVFAWLANSASRYTEEYLLSGGEDKKKKFFSSLAASFFPLCLISTAACGVFSLVSGDASYMLTALMLLGTASFQVFGIILVQTRKRLAYTVLTVYSAAGKLALAMILANVAGLSPATPAVALIAYGSIDLSAFIAAGIISGFFKRISSRSVSRAAVGLFLRYGFPLIGVGFSVALLNQAYRYIIVYSYGDAVFGVYFANASIASAVFTMLMVGIMRAVYPNIIKAYRDGGVKKAEDTLASGARLYLLIAVPSAAGLAAVAPAFSGLILDEKYAAGVPVIGLTAFGMLFLGLTEYANKAWEINKNTKPILANSLTVAVINIAANLVTIPLLGFMAAAVNLLISYVLYFALSYLRGRRLLALRIRGRTLFSICGGGLACFLAAYGAGLLPLGRLMSLAVSITAGGVAYAAVLLLSGELGDEISSLRGLLKRKLRA